MSEPIKFHFSIDGNDFTSAGKASVQVKKLLRQMDFDADTIRRVSVAMYEGEINMVIHADGGSADVNVWNDKIQIILADKGPGIPDVEMAMKERFSVFLQELRDAKRVDETIPIYTHGEKEWNSFRIFR